MLEMRPDCERCEGDLAPESQAAHICSIECTFCEPCSDIMKNICPNCGGVLVTRPTRKGRALEKNPPSTQRHFKPA